MTFLEKYQLGNLTLENRIVMAPLTRSRATNNIPNSLMTEYYEQRAGAGLIISEGTSPSPNGLGYPRIPGAYSDEQIQGWKNIADAVHAKGGKIFVQLMHTGRISAEISLPEGAEVLAPSAILAAGEIYTDEGMLPHSHPKEMSVDQLLKAQDEYVFSAKRLIVEAGIDGVELHAANGYLLNQFLNPKSNHRKDAYGGDIKNRARFVIETTKKVVDAIGADKVGIRFSPYGAYNDMEAHYQEVEAMFSYLATEMANLKVAYIHIVDQRVAFAAPDFLTDIKKTIKDNFKATVIVGGDVDSQEKTEEVFNDGFDLVYVGRPFISNPDFVQKLTNKSTLKTADSNTFFTAGAEGYTTY